MKDKLYDTYNNYCEYVRSKNTYRELHSIENDTMNFQSNDYLNLSKNKNIINQSIEYTKKYGASNSSSRLLLNNKIFLEIEKKIAQCMGYESSILLNTGYQGNSSIIQSLLDKNILKQESIILSDKLNHNSIHNGCVGVKQTRYRHLDMNHLEYLLKKNPNKFKFILSETVFGMDGDMVQIDDITFLSKKYNAFLYLDEAHSIGLYGDNGYGLTANLSQYIDCAFGTFSKAAGAFGAFVACRADLKNYFINKCNGFIYSTALPPSVLGSIKAALKEIPKMNKERALMIKNANYLKEKLSEIGLECIGKNTNIVCIIIKDNAKLLKIQEQLKLQNIMVSAIREPSVPSNSSRIRIAIRSNHTKEHILALIEAIKANV